MKIRSKRRAGFTLIEMMISLSIFAVLGVSIAVCVEMGSNSQKTVYSIAAEDRALRELSSLVTDELRTSTDSEITVTTLADGNHELTFRTPVESGGNLLWGVYDKSLGTTYADQNKVDWKLRYTVRSVADSSGQVVKKLVRQILNAASAVQKEEVLAEDLHTGTDAAPGFKVVKSGEMWVVTVSTAGKSAQSPGIKAVFHVQTRN